MPDEVADTRLVLVRHGQAQSFVEGVIGGPTGCSGLSEHGRSQVEALRDRLQRTGELAGADVVYTSTLARAIQTAEILLPAIGPHELRQDCDLCEVHTGDELDGMRWEEYRATHGARNASAGSLDPYRDWGPGAETWAEFVFRTARRLQQLVDEHEGEQIVVVCHGGVVRASMHLFANLPLETHLGMEAENTSITEWRIKHRDAAGPRRNWLVRFSDAAHLSDLT